MRAVIFANGEIRKAASLKRVVQRDDWVIAADGGAEHCRRWGLRPAVLIGDMDSIPPARMRGYTRAGIEVVAHARAKDQTDLELALSYAVEHGADEIVILGALGGRWDQTAANLMLLAAEPFRRIRVRLRDGDDEIQVLHGGESLTLDGAPGDVVSLLPLGVPAEGVTTSGLVFPLADETLLLGSTRGVSNVIAAVPCRVSLRRGVLLCFHRRQIHRTRGLSSSRKIAGRGLQGQRRRPGRRQRQSAEHTRFGAPRR